MATILTTTSINNLIYTYEYTQRNALVTPLSTNQKKYESLNTAFTNISSKLNSFKSVLNTFKQTGSDSVFSKRSAASSNTTYVSATADNTAAAGSYNIHVDQLAASDLAVSQSLSSTLSNPVTGTQTFQITSGDGSTGQFVSNVAVTFGTSETNQTMMEKIRDAVNSDKATVSSNAKTGTSSYSGGASEFTIDLNGKVYTVAVNGGGTYSDLITEISSYITNNITGVTAEKISNSPNSGDVSLKLTVKNSNDYISIANSSGFDVVSDLGISVSKEKAASALVSASVFVPTSGYSQLSFTSKQTGVDNRIKSLDDTGSSSALAAIGLNLSSTRTSFDQTANVAGYVNADISVDNNKLNSKFVFNGLSLQNNLNKFSDLINGVAVSFNSVMKDSDADTTISVGIDVSGIKSKVEEFVTSFNTIYNYLKQNSIATKDARGILMGQANSSSLLDMLRSAATTPVAGVTDGNLKYLSQIGITFNSQTGLSISDSTLLQKKITENLDQVENLFNSESGIASTLYTKVEPYVGANGYLAIAQNNFAKNINYNKDRITAAESRITRASDILRNRYEDLQSQLASLANLQTQFFGSSSFSLSDLYS